MTRVLHHAPRVVLLDARPAGLAERGLRDWARTESSTRAAAYVARSYRHPYALVAWHDGPVGVDVERVERCDDAFARLVCTPAEWAESVRADDRDTYLTELWSSKEALAKALGDALDYEPARLESPLRWPGGEAGPWRALALDLPEGHVGWVCWRAAQRGRW